MEFIHLLVHNINQLGVYNEQQIAQLCKNSNVGFRCIDTNSDNNPNQYIDDGFIIYPLEHSNWDIGNFTLFVSVTGETNLIKLPH